MWLQSENPTVRVRTKNFSCSSFKDIQNLCSDDSPQQPPPHHLPNSPRVASAFRRVRLVDSLLRTWSTRQSQSQPSISLPGTQHLITLYHTSLHVVRSTFDDCRDVRSILLGFNVAIDERDVSMDSKFVDELRGIFGNCTKGGRVMSLPRVFIGGRYVGGAEEVRRMHESGELKKLVRGLPAAERGACGMCGGYRFVLCDECSGSHKRYYSEKGGFRTCAACNENGLVRCPKCSVAV